MAGMTALGLGIGRLTVAVSVSAQDATPAPAGLGPAPTGGPAAAGGWSFTDDRGVVVELDAAPSTVVACIGIAAALHDFGYDVAAFFSGESREAVDPATVAPDLPFDTIDNLGAGDALDVEGLLAMGADLFVGANYDINGAQIIWQVPDDVMAQIGEFAGIVAIAYSDGTDVGRLIQTNANLAEALGADLTVESVQTARRSCDASLTALGSAIEAKPGLTALFMTGAPDGFYIGKGLADLNLYAQQGLDILAVESFDLQSWEVVRHPRCRRDLRRRSGQRLAPAGPDGRAGAHLAGASRGGRRSGLSMEDRIRPQLQGIRADPGRGCHGHPGSRSSLLATAFSV